MKRILSFGSLVHPDAVARIPEASEAANRFQMGLLSGLRSAGVAEAVGVTAFPIASVPPRKVIVRSQRWSVGDGIGVIAPGFVNLPPLKPLSVHRALRSAGLEAAADGAVDAVLSYNATPGPGSAALAVARRLGVPFVCVVADYSRRHPRSPLREAEFRWHTRIIQASDALVVLSGHTVADLGLSVPWIKLDGGLSGDWEALPATEALPRTVVFAGTPTYASGALMLLEAFIEMDDAASRLIFTGRGGLEEEIRAAAASDPRIQIKGFLDRAEMQEVLASATVLVNPRLSSEEENRFNFPSKMLDYLASARPALTTLAGDLDPVYREVAIPITEETPAGLARLLASTLARPPAELTALGQRGRDFVLGERRWRDQAVRVYDLLSALITS